MNRRHRCLFCLLSALAACTVDPDGFNGRRPRKANPEMTGELPTGEAPAQVAEQLPGAIIPPAQRTSDAVFSAAAENFPNPERGFYQEYDDLLTVSDAVMAATENAGLRLVMGIVRLDAFRTNALSPAVLDNLNQAFALLRGHGLKAILRFAYNSPTELDYLSAADTSLTFVRQHLRELKPVLRANADVVAFWQAGFIGAWGEWHSSSNNLATPAGKLAVRDALLDALPAGRTLQVRNAADVMVWFPSTMAEDTMPASAGAAVFGLHNDCFLSSNNDVATYDADPGIGAAQRAYVRAMTAVTPFGGETCNPPAAELAQMRSRCEDVLTEARDYHLTYLNRDYFTPGFQDKWMVEGCYSTVAASMGYRLALDSAAHAPIARRGETFTLTFSVRNRGWARLTNARPLHVVLRHRATGKLIDQVAEGVEPRAWLPGDKVFTVQARIALPLDAELGDHDVLLALPDPAPALAADPRYAVRWANVDNPDLAQNWEPARGRFRLGTTLQVK